MCKDQPKKTSNKAPFNALTETHLGSSRWHHRMVLAHSPCPVELRLQHGSQALSSGVILTGPHTCRTGHADGRLRKSYIGLRTAHSIYDTPTRGATTLLVTENSIKHTILWSSLGMGISNLSLHPKKFQMLGRKQVFGVSAVLSNLSKQKEYSHLTKICPSCTATIEYMSHIKYCLKEGRIPKLDRQAIIVSYSGSPPHTHNPSTLFLIIKYIQHRGLQSMTEILAIIPTCCYDNLVVS